MSRPVVHVVAGVVKDPSGRILVAQRPAGKHLAGYWEFPGGKSDPGEAPFDALRRELAEEIGIEVHSAEPLIAVPWSYPEKRIVLDAWTVAEYSGVAHAREDQPLRWVDIDELAHLPMPDADAPIIRALRLPDRYLITPSLAPGAEAKLLDGVERACAAGIRLIQLRLPEWMRDEIASTASRAHAITARHGATLLLNADWETAERCGLDGVHVPARIAARLDARPVSSDRWFAVSCHDADELAHAQQIGADFATLAPVAPTPSHADAVPLGWQRFAEWVADSAIPIYALGGLGADDIRAARSYGAQGVAGIRAFWP
ncbi:MAG TPA: Nudix family hydrolase [Rhodanobacteraceae bacterium]|jgi:8-oxo-dGTP diphosphatase|nr:Nudix family hydrolase [Rhodanobacteraceae bacterium]